MADTLKTAVESSTALVSILDTIKWPLLIVIFIIIFQKQLKNLLSRTTKIGYKDIGIDAAPPQQDSGTSLDKKGVGTTTSATTTTTTTAGGTVQVDKWLSMYSDDTIKRSKELIKTETGVADEADAENKSQLLYHYAAALYLVIQFERIYRYIYGSQISMLDFLNSNFNATKESLKTFYDQAVTANPNSFANYSYESYLDYLFQNNLIYTNANNILISWMGRDFLKYLTENGYQKNLPY